MKFPIAAVLSAALTWSAGAHAQTPTRPQDKDSAPRYTFSWPLDGSTLKPRGGTTKGVPVTVDTADLRPGRRCRRTDLTTLERDRRAILAMAARFG